MTTATLKNLRTITYDAKGKPDSVLLNLKNRDFRKFYEVMIEDYLDILTVKRVMKNDDGTRFTMIKKGGSFIFEEVKQ